MIYFFLSVWKAEAQEEQKDLLCVGDCMVYISIILYILILQLDSTVCLIDIVDGERLRDCSHMKAAQYDQHNPCCSIPVRAHCSPQGNSLKLHAFTQGQPTDYKYIISPFFTKHSIVCVSGIYNSHARTAAQVTTLNIQIADIESQVISSFDPCGCIPKAEVEMFQ